MHCRKLTGFLLIHVLGAAALLGTNAFAAELTAQSSESDGVTIAVKPVDISPGAAAWSFEVSLSTHTKDLNDDLVRTTYIVNRAGKKKEAPTGWKGDAAGGHHRKGVLSFKAITPPPTALELRIQRVGEKAPRVFRWDLNCLCNDPKMHTS